MLKSAAAYVPEMYDYEWEVRCGKDVLGRLISYSEAKYKTVTEKSDMRISDLPEYRVFCKKVQKHD